MLIMKKILIVDDDPEILDLMQFIFKEFGEVYITKFAQDAIDLFLVHKFDLVVIDFQMPVQNGIKLMHILRDYENEIPVIIMTACHDIDIFERAVDAGADAFIKKPFDVEEIRDLTKSLISVEKRNNSIKESFDSLSCSY